MAPTMPYDFSGYLADALEQSSGLAHGYNAQLDSFRDRLDEADKYAETGYAPVLGGSALGAIGAALAGGSVGQIAGGAYGAGQLAYNNLELIEKSKRENLQKEIAFTEGLAKDNINFSQQLVGAQNTYNMNRDLSYLRGEMPGTQPYNIEQTDQYNRQMDLVRARDSVGPGTEPLLPQNRALLNQVTGQEYPENVSLKQGNLGYEMAAELRRDLGADINRAKFNQSLAQRKVPGLKEIVPGATTPQNMQIASDMAKAYENVKSSYEELADIYAKEGDAIFFGNKAQAVAMRVSRIVNEYRNLYQTGANLTGKEQPMLFTNAPADFDVNGWTSVIQQKLRGQGPQGFLREAQSNLDSLFSNSMLPLNQVNPSYKYSEDDLKRYGLREALMRQDAQIPTNPITTDRLGRPIETPTSQTTIQGYKPLSPQEIASLTPEQKQARIAELKAMLGGR